MNDSKTSSRGEAESLYACGRLGAALLLMTIGGAAMYGVVVALPALQAEFGVSRADASLPYTLTMVGFGLGGILMGRLADRFGVIVPVVTGALSLGAGFLLCGMSVTLWQFSLAHGLLAGLLGCAATFAPLVADTSMWFTRRRDAGDDARLRHRQPAGFGLDLRPDRRPAHAAARLGAARHRARAVPALRRARLAVYRLGPVRLVPGRPGPLLRHHRARVFQARRGRRAPRRGAAGDAARHGRRRMGIGRDLRSHRLLPRGLRPRHRLEPPQHDDRLLAAPARSARERNAPFLDGVTGHRVDELGALAPAALVGVRAARMEAAPRQRRERVGHFARHGGARLAGALDLRDGLEQHARIGMTGA